MTIQSDKLVELVNGLREQILAETDGGDDALAVTGFLMLTFAVDAQPDRVKDETVKALMVEAVEWAFDKADEIGFAPEAGH